MHPTTLGEKMLFSPQHGMDRRDKIIARREL